MKDVLGGKGAGLAEMTNLGIPVPPGFTIAASLCLSYLETRQFSALRSSGQVEQRLQRLEDATRAASSASRHNPLLVSVRSGAAVSMPGMMETILNLGLNDDDRARGSPRQSGNAALRLGLVSPLRADVRRRGVRPAQGALRAPARGAARSRRASSATSTSRPSQLQALVQEFKAHVRRRPGSPSPTTRWSSSGARSRRCSRAGTPGGRSTTGSCTTSPTRWAPRSTS